MTSSSAKFANELAMFAERWGGDDAMVVKMLAGKSPRERAAELISGSTLSKVDVRRQLAKGGAAAINSSDDSLLQFFKAIEPDYRKLRETQDELDEIQRQAYAQIDEANVALKGASGYPDATFTLRLAFGKVKGYKDDGRAIAPWTTMGGAFQARIGSRGKRSWQLPQTWHNARNKVDGSTPLNFVCTADIIGGNSGSPVINRAGELVGVIFDSNIQGLTASYFYDDEVARAISCAQQRDPRFAPQHLRSRRIGRTTGKMKEFRLGGGYITVGEDKKGEREEFRGGVIVSQPVSTWVSRVPSRFGRGPFGC